MKFTKIEREVLTKALRNQTTENRNAPSWRPAVKCPLPAPPQEVNQDPVPPALYETSSRDYQSSFNPNVFLQEVKKILGDEIVPGRTNVLYAENFMRAGFIYAAGKVCYSRIEAQKIIDAWSTKAPDLGYFILPELEVYADLFAAEVVGGIEGVGAEYKTRHMVISLDADPKAVESYEKAALSLEKKGLAVRVQGQDMTRKWSGLNATKMGAEALKELEAAEAPPAASEPEPPGPRLKCHNCKEVFHSVTDEFNADARPLGNMFKLLPKYKARSWEEWRPDWEGDSLTCPGCGANVVSPHTGFLHDDVIIEAVEA